jgi:hypothetical protein
MTMRWDDNSTRKISLCRYKKQRSKIVMSYNLMGTFKTTCVKKSPLILLCLDLFLPLSLLFLFSFLLFR